MNRPGSDARNRIVARHVERSGRRTGPVESRGARAGVNAMGFVRRGRPRCRTRRSSPRPACNGSDPSAAGSRRAVTSGTSAATAASVKCTALPVHPPATETRHRCHRSDHHPGCRPALERPDNPRRDPAAIEAAGLGHHPLVAHMAGTPWAPHRRRHGRDRPEFGGRRRVGPGACGARRVGPITS